MSDEPMNAQEAAAFLERRKQQLADEAASYPPEAMIEALRAAHEKMATLEIERDHYFLAAQRTSMVVAYFADQEGGELRVPVAAIEALDKVMVSYEVVDGEVVVLLEDPPAASPEGESG